MSTQDATIFVRVVMKMYISLTLITTQEDKTAVQVA